MSYRPQYYDSNIYMQSTNLILKAADLYYNQGMRQQEISERNTHLLRINLVDEPVERAEHLDLHPLHLAHVRAERGNVALYVLFQHDHAGKIRVARAEHFADGSCDGVRCGVDRLIACKLADIR